MYIVPTYLLHICILSKFCKYDQYVLNLALLDLVFDNCPTNSIAIKGLKRTIIRTLLESDTSKDIFNEDVISRIKNSGVVQSNTINAPQPGVLVEDMVI